MLVKFHCTSLVNCFSFIRIPNVLYSACTVTHLKVKRLVSACSFSNIYEICQGNLPIDVLHIGCTCYARLPWPIFDDFYLSIFILHVLLLSPLSSSSALCLPFFSYCLLSSSSPHLLNSDGELNPTSIWLPSVVDLLIMVDGQCRLITIFDPPRNPQLAWLWFPPHSCLIEKRPCRSGSHFGLIT